MKRFVVLAITLLILVTLVGCDEKTKIEVEKAKEEVVEEIDKVKDEIVEQVEDVKEEILPIQIKESTDRHIAYINNYVGKNCASVGYTSIGGDRNDYIGKAYIHLIYETADGTYVDIDDEEDLKKYVVVSQSIKPNTEVKLGFSLDENGEEFDNLIDFQSYEEIELRVKKIKENITFENDQIEIKPAIDRYTYYMPNFIGRNLTTCGYVSLMGDLRFRLGKANCKINVITDDGSFVELEKESLKKYVVYAQSVEPNTEFKITFQKDSEGVEYESLVDQQSYDQIDLYVKEIISQ